MAIIWQDKVHYRFGDELETPCPTCGQRVQELIHTQQISPEVQPDVWILVPCSHSVEPGSVEWHKRDG